MKTARPPRLGHEELLAEVRSALAASGRGEGSLRVGLEVEVIPVRPDGSRLPLEAPAQGGLSGRCLLEEAAGAGGWAALPDTGRSPGWELPGGASVGFEPGGQVEVRTPPLRSPGRAAAMASAALETLHGVAERRGARLLTRGMDPLNPVGAVDLLLDSPRYRRQLRHYETIGPWGRRMMLMSAAIHLNVDLGGRAVRRWTVANRMAPYLTALFANSPRWEGEEAGIRSFRAEQWRHLDPTRTGLFGDEGDPAREYLAFALAARDFLGGSEEGPAAPFRARWEAGAGLEAWQAHLTTLFPEVRPRSYLELRSVDALRPAWLPVPTLLVTGILYDPAALEEAHFLLPPAESERLRRAGRAGMGDPELADTALQLLDLGLEGAARRAGDRETEAGLEVARAFRDRFTARGLDPGDEEDGLDPFRP